MTKSDYILANRPDSNLANNSYQIVQTLHHKKHGFHLECTGCKKIYHSSRQLKCSQDASLLRTVYDTKKIHLKNSVGMGRFYDWLPIQNQLKTDAGPVTYKSEGFANELGLSNLYICFNGYWPERGAFIKTCSFKELEAHPTMQNIEESGAQALVLASAGNTARAFAYAANHTDIDLYIIVPGSGISRMWLPGEVSEKVHLIEMSKNCDYTDAIHLADRISQLPGMLPEGGARNVARRDGMGTVMLDGTITMKKLPDHYFQAVGSGTGGIAAWEASLRLLGDGRFGNSLPVLHLAQNLPFAPMYNAWMAGRREIIKDIDMPDAKRLIEEMYADILSNREPPYSVTGGLFDALSATSGRMYGIENREAVEAKKIFENVEGIDIFPPAAVAVAALMQAVESGIIQHDDAVLLNITGGGLLRLEEDYDLVPIKPESKADTYNVPVDEIIKEIIPFSR